MTLYVVWKMRRSMHRVEWAGNERLEILREQQARLQFLREERRMLEEELEWRRALMDGEGHLSAGHQLELNAPSKSNGHLETEQLRWRTWWQRMVGW